MIVSQLTNIVIGACKTQRNYFVLFAVIGENVMTLRGTFKTAAAAAKKAIESVGYDVGWVYTTAERATSSFNLTTVEGVPATLEANTIKVVQHENTSKPESSALAEKYPKYWKRLPDEWAAVDVYRVCQLFPVDDASGRINHARKKLLVPGVRTGGKSMQKDIQEAIDTLQSWLNDNPEKPA